MRVCSSITVSRRCSFTRSSSLSPHRISTLASLSEEERTADDPEPGDRRHLGDDEVLTEQPLDEDSLKKLGIVMKRAQYFLTCSGRMTPALRSKPENVLRALTALEAPAIAPQYEQLSLFPSA